MTETKLAREFVEVVQSAIEAEDVPVEIRTRFTLHRRTFVTYEGLKTHAQPAANIGRARACSVLLRRKRETP